MLFISTSTGIQLNILSITTVSIIISTTTATVIIQKLTTTLTTTFIATQ